MTKERKQWDVNDYAFMIYADRKGLKGNQIASAMEVSNSSVYTQTMKLKRPEKYGQKAQKIIHKAEVMAQSVLAGEYPDTRTVWNDRIERATGLHYDLNPELPVEEEKPEEAVPERLTLLELTVNVSTLAKIIKILKG